MAGLKLDKSRLSMERAELKLGKAEDKVAMKRSNRKLYDKAKPSEKLHEKAKPSAKLKLRKKGQFAAEEAMTSKKLLGKQNQAKMRENLVKAPEKAVSSGVHHEISKYEDENVGIQAFHKTEEAVEKSVQFTNYTIKSQIRKNKLRPIKNLEKAEKKLHKAEKKLHRKTVNYRFEKHKIDNKAEYSQSSTLSRWQQKQKIKKAYIKEYRLQKMGKTGKDVGKTASSTTKTASSVGRKMLESGKTVVTNIAKNPKLLLILGGVLLLLCIISSFMSAGGMLSQGVTNSVVSSSYLSEESDMLEVEANYKAKETALATEIANIETTYPDYDDYIYYLSEIGHDPHDLAALLTALYMIYTPDMVADMLDVIFEKQYTLTMEVNSDNALVVTLTNTPISTIAREILTDDEYEHFLILQDTLGNNPDLFGDYAGSTGSYLDYEIPSHHLSDDKFAAMIAEAEKYLGYPYVWGGSTPSTSFDCSGFVCWVLNASGVMDIGRTTAQGIFNQMITIPASERQAGDIIFFTGTYDSVGAVSHVGIYVGDGMMIHCGNPISYVSVDSGYWTNYFYAYGRIP